MEIFVKSPLQFILERGVASLIVAIITLGYFFDGHTNAFGLLVLAVGVGIMIAVLAVRTPTKLTLLNDALVIGYNRGADLVIPYKNIKPDIAHVQRFRLHYKNAAGKKVIIQLGAYWRKEGVAVNNIVVAQALARAAKENLNY